MNKQDYQITTFNMNHFGLFFSTVNSSIEQDFFNIYNFFNAFVLITIT